jgi:hypothetical protein
MSNSQQKNDDFVVEWTFQHHLINTFCEMNLEVGFTWSGCHTCHATLG